MAVSLFLYALVVLALLIAELREDRRAQFFFKPMAAFGFVILALQFGALESTYGKYILVGLIACAVGDVMLLSRKSQNMFLGGMAAFALGHLIYSFGFMVYGVELVGVGMNANKPIGLAIVMAMLCLACAVHIIVKTDLDMKLPVCIYTIIITVMVVLAMLTDNPFIMWGAFLFATSDYFVGMDRFIDPKKIWALAITPLYFGAQALFALNVSI
jgi:uncharacterized membrane protein YhhN